MSQFSVFAGPDVAVEDEPRILSFAKFAAEKKASSVSAPVRRAVLTFHNSSCPCCHRAKVEPIELNDGVMTANGAMIPNTGTIVAFSCHSCGHQWKA